MFSKNRTLISLIGPLVLLLTATYSMDPVDIDLKPDPNGATLHTQKVNLILDDYDFRPDTIRVQAGHPVVLHLTNEGVMEHEFMAGKNLASNHGNFNRDLFKGVDVEKTMMSSEEETEAHEENAMTNKEGEEHEEEHEHHGTMIELEPGQSGTMEFTLPSSKTGTWKIGCFEESDENYHYDLGMDGVLIVTPE